MPPLKQFKRLDVRPLLQQGREPLSTIRAGVARLKPGQGLLVIAPFLPAPLIELLRGEGFLSKVEHGRQGAWRVYFWRDTD